MFTTLQDRNPIGFSVNGGLTLHDPLPGRDNDVFGLGFGVARVSSGASNYDRHLQVFEPAVYTPVRGAETFFEATYQAQLLPSVADSSPTSSTSSTRARDRQPRPADAEDQERIGDRPAHDASRSERGDRRSRGAAGDAAARRDGRRRALRRRRCGATTATTKNAAPAAST